MNPVIVVIILAVSAILVGLFRARRLDATSIGPWEKHAVCKCGWWTKPSFGDLFFVREEVCPHCARPKEQLKIVTRRWNGPLDEYEELA